VPAANRQRRDQTASLARLSQSFSLSLEAENKSPRTIQGYAESLRLFITWLDEQGHATTIGSLDRHHVEEFITDQLARLKPSTAATRYKGLRVFFEWAVRDEEIETSPMAKMKPPAIPETMVPVLTENDMRALIKACGGRDFADRRDLAIIWMLADTGIRRAECAGLTLDDIDLSGRVLSVLGKGRRRRMVRFGKKTAAAVDRYLRIRDSHPLADQSWLWLGTSGRRFSDQGLRQMLERRGEQAGVKLHAHQFRHTYVHQHLANGGNEGDLMYLTGWKSRQMLTRYGASVAAERARGNYRSPWEGL